MHASRSMIRWLACAAAALALSACGGGGGGSGTTPPAGTVTTGSTTTTATSTVAATTPYTVAKLVSDTAAGAGAHVDPNLVNAWGVAFNPQAFVWVTDKGANKSTLYDGAGVPQTLVGAIPPGSAGSSGPMGIDYNGGGAFRVTQGFSTSTSIFIFAGEAGTISGWSPVVNGTNAVTVIDDGAAGNVYTGLALTATFDRLFAADFRHGHMTVFDSTFARLTPPGFDDQNVPVGFAPYGVQVIGGTVYVAYARADATQRAAQAGAGLGFIDTFTTSGVFIKRLVANGGALNAPWGMAMAPANFGTFSNALLVSNAGDGRINAFDPATGALLGTLADANGPLVIDGLHGIAFGNDLNAQPSNTLFFAAGPSGGTHGIYGRIDSR